MNGLTPAQTERFGKLSEEMCEAGQVLGKIQVHGTHPSCEGIQYDNTTDLERELGDVLTAIDLLAAAGDINMDRVKAFRDKKRKTIFRYLVHQQGIVLP